MAVTTGQPVVTKVLDTETSARVLAEAIRSRTLMSLFPIADPGEELLSGVVQRKEGEHLLFTVYSFDQAALAIHGCSRLQVEFSLAGSFYCFDTRIEDEADEARTGVVRIHRPASVAVLDRRRSRRRRFREGSEVALCATPDAAAWSCTADMLNLSTHGIACRVPAEDAKFARVGRLLGVAFQVGTPPQEFNLTSRVVTNIRAGTPQQAVLGMEFVDQPGREVDSERLQAALGSTS